MNKKATLVNENKIDKAGIVILFIEVLLFLVGNVAGFLALYEVIPYALGLWIIFLVAISILLILSSIGVYNVWKKLDD